MYISRAWLSLRWNGNELLPHTFHYSKMTIIQRIYFNVERKTFFNICFLIHIHNLLKSVGNSLITSEKTRIQSCFPFILRRFKLSFPMEISQCYLCFITFMIILTSPLRSSNNVYIWSTFAIIRCISFIMCFFASW